MPRYEDAARELAEAAAEACGGTSRWILGEERTDSSAPVYAPSYGPLRRIVHVAETTGNFGRLIAAHSPDVVRALAEVVARLRERVAEGHAHDCMPRFRPKTMACKCGHEEDREALARLDAVTGGGR